MNEPFSVPDEIELLAFFEAEPVERTVEDGYWCYEVRDQRGIRLQFSFKLYERAVETALLIGDIPIATVVHEGAETMRLEGRTLTCRFAYAGAQAKLMLRLGESISVEWTSLQTA